MCEIKAEAINLNKLNKYNENNKAKKFYIIPEYQRLYVWKKENIEKFFDDILSTFIKNNEKEYFIGNIIFVDKNNNNYDIVDGQQRFTTLFILLKVIYELENNDSTNLLKDILYRNDNFTLKCFAREFANNFFKNNFQKQITYTEENNIKPLVDAYNILKDNLTKNKEKIDYNKFAKYLINNVQFALTIIPNNINVNQLFETMNTTSVQLEQHQVLKARILSKVAERNDENYSLYANIWDFVSNMNRSILNSKSTLDKILSELIKNESIKNIINNISTNYNTENNDNEDYNSNTKDKNNEDNQVIENKHSSLFELIKNIADDNKENNKINKIQDENTLGNQKSIINFTYFLLHTLRLFYLYFYPNEEEKLKDLIVNDKKLISIFNDYFLKKVENDYKNIINFFSLLIINRYCFDKFIIKKEENHIIISDNLNKDFAMLQCLLYHSQSEKRYWLTPLLYQILSLYKEENQTEEIIKKAYKYLLKAEHILYNTNYNIEVSESEITLKISKENINDIKDKNNYYDREYLEKSKGTSFAHYIFYKLEFIIYYFYNNINLLESKEELKDLKDLLSKFKQIEDYKILSRNSIEHIIPQSDNSLNNDIKDSFGNLVLISVGMNSEYSNKSFLEKKAKFEDKAIKENTIDSLKSLIIYQNETFEENYIIKHRDDMINLIDFYHDEMIKL